MGAGASVQNSSKSKNEVQPNKKAPGKTSEELFPPIKPKQVEHKDELSIREIVSKDKAIELANALSKHLEGRASKAVKDIENEVTKSIETVSKLFKNPEIILRLHDDPEDPHYGVGFTTSIFRKKEWFTLKRFCLEHSIYQADLNSAFNR